MKTELEAEHMQADAEARRRIGVAELLGPAVFTPLQDDLQELGVWDVEDLQELEAEHIERLAAKLSFVQAKKFAKKVAALLDE